MSLLSDFVKIHEANSKNSYGACLTVMKALGWENKKWSARNTFASSYKKLVGHFYEGLDPNSNKWRTAYGLKSDIQLYRIKHVDNYLDNNEEYGFPDHTECSRKKYQKYIQSTKTKSKHKKSNKRKLMNKDDDGDSGDDDDDNVQYVPKKKQKIDNSNQQLALAEKQKIKRYLIKALNVVNDGNNVITSNENEMNKLKKQISQQSDKINKLENELLEKDEKLKESNKKQNMLQKLYQNCVDKNKELKNKHQAELYKMEQEHQNQINNMLSS